jgi:hypothetical protein
MIIFTVDFEEFYELFFTYSNSKRKFFKIKSLQRQKEKASIKVDLPIPLGPMIPDNF